MAVSAVHLESDAFLVCMNHALSTEKEEVMGLCIGEVDTNRIVHIHSVIILRRSDKRKDRVEISPEQLSAASTEAEISFDILSLTYNICIIIYITFLRLFMGLLLLSRFSSFCNTNLVVKTWFYSSSICAFVICMYVCFSVFTKNLCSQMSAISGPLLQWLEDRLEQNKQSIIKLQKEKEQLTQELASL
uniref:BRCA1/BRCA2-containing complex, subunit 3 n=1 Tax=Sinocyclocheilus rhinocerous TaxID=307959 RepID=A0A673LRS0_9TELE